MMDHIINSQQFTRKLIDEIFEIADRKRQVNKTLKDRIMACLFYEPSTRTRFSFESAMLRLGGGVITTENAGEFSSAAKGETLEDTIRIVSSYADIIVLRHPEQGASNRAALVSKVPIINAGDGGGQHPTQALLDLYTIKKELGRLDNLTVGIIGDLKHGRTARSLAYMLGKYRKIKIFLVTPKQLKIGNDIKKYLEKHSIDFEETEVLNEVIKKVDVLYVTRIQKERFLDQKQYKKLKGFYKVTPAIVEKMKPASIVMHPLPRLDEISKEVDDLPQAVYFKQAEYGLRVRMALLQLLLHKR